ncbi:phage tail tape measure protein [Rufibacter hautae]|uniref:Phage tail tape measure protein domain-containing protein n=1 Tax=Rufibacter hautae TaxID=2595005 RepID=A0A5B6TJM1_9BACT|nr:phage tail tape measure protein [Rufibacter hautae]KAA3439565.1 hypothetical protein FOA19_02450 [Rufibacter hautae]
MATDRTTREIEIIANGQKFNASVKEMTGAQALLNAQINKMATDDPRRKDLIRDFQEMKKRTAEARQEIHGVTQAQQTMQKGTLASRLGIEGVTSATGLLKVGFKAAVAAFLPLLAFQTIVDLGRAFLGLVNDVDKVKGAWQSLGVTQDQELNSLYARTSAYAQTFGKENNEVINSAKVLAKEFGISFEEAFELMEKGTLAGADASGQFLDNIKEYSTQFAGAKVSAEDFVAELAKSENRGIFSDKAPDVVKEFGLRIREQTKATGEALDAAFGQGFTDKIFKGLNEGTMTTAEALRQVSKQMNDTTIPASKLQTVIADVFGGPGEDAGIEYLRSLQDLGGELDSMVDKTNGLTESQIEQLEANKALAAAEAELGETFAGTGATLDVIWTNIKTFGLLVLNAFVLSIKELRNEMVGSFEAVKAFGSGIADVFKKLTSGDFSGAAEEFGKIGDKSSKAYWQGYVKYEMEAKKEEEIRKKQEADKAAAAAADQARKEGGATRAEKEKAAKAAAKEEERRRKEAAAALRKAREEFDRAEAAAEIELAKLKVDVMQDGVDKVLAKLRLQHQLEKAELEKQKEVVKANAAATYTEKQALLDNLQEQQRLKDEELKAAELKAQEDEKKRLQEEAARTLEEKLAKYDEDQQLKAELLENEFLNDQTRLEDQSLRALEAEQALDMALLELKKATAAAKLADLEAAGQAESLAAVKLKNEILKTDKEIADGKKANAQATAEFKAKMMRLETDNFKYIMDVGLEFFAADEASRKKNANVIKAFTAGKIIADLMQEISGYMAHPASIGTFGLSGTAKSVIATARAGMALEQVRTQAFADGGMTRSSGSKALINMVERGGMWEMASGYSGGSIGTFAEGGWVNSAKLGLIGERGAELVIPNWMISSPKYANTVSWLESERQRGVAAFADGGSTAPTTLPGVPEPDQEMKFLLQQMLLEFREMREDLSAWPTRLQVHNNVADIQEKIITLNDLVEMSEA